MKPTVKIILNLVLTFAGAYGAMILDGSSPKMALAAGLVAMAANGAGLIQQPPAGK